MYAEASSPRSNGHIACLFSPFYDPTEEGLCFEFWYHMVGRNGTNRKYIQMMYYTRITHAQSKRPISCESERNSSDKYLYMPPFQPQFLPSFRR